MSPKIIGNREGERKSNIDLGLAEKLNRKAEEGTMEEPERIEPKEPNKGLEYNLEEKPVLNLTPLEKTAVHTSTQKEYWEVMRVYECGDWAWWSDGYLPTSRDYWERHEEETCVSAEEIFFYGPRSWYEEERNRDIISSQEFYNTQGITQEQIQEINEWFENQPEE